MSDTQPSFRVRTIVAVAIAISFIAFLLAITPPVNEIIARILIALFASGTLLFIFGMGAIGVMGLLGLFDEDEDE